MQKNILILFAHPNQDKSEINLRMFQEAQEHAKKHAINVEAVDLYAEYPLHNIDVKKEQQRLVNADAVIFLFPLYWYSTPAILKDWQDLVLEYGFAYGKNGCALKGKQFLCVISAGAHEAAYSEAGLNHYSINDLLRPLEQTARLTQMDFMPPFVLFGAREAKDNGVLERHLQMWRQVLDGLSNNSLNVCGDYNACLIKHMTAQQESPQ